MEELEVEESRKGKRSCWDNCEVGYGKEEEENYCEEMQWRKEREENYQ